MTPPLFPQLSAEPLLRNLAINARLAFLGLMPESKVIPLLERMDELLAYAPDWLQQAGTDSEPSDNYSLLMRLDDLGYPPLRALQREVGLPAMWALITLREIRSGARDSAIQAGMRLRYLGPVETADKAGRQHMKKLRAQQKATAARYRTGKVRTVLTRWARTRSAGISRRESVKIIAEGTGIDPDYIRKILRRHCGQDNQ